MGGDTSTRRRGQELEDALLDAAWAELIEVGYGGFTIEGVAERARTSRPVLYRRWPNRADLAIAAVRRHGWHLPVPVPDTGSVREDLIELLAAASKMRAELAVLFSVQMGQYFTETETSPAQLREQLMSHRTAPFGLDEVLRRGVQRGEIDPAKLTPRIANLPTDLMRHELMMTLRPVPAEVIVEIVDDMFLPLVRPAVPSTDGIHRR
jgi:AcrR family transcriptional regulator